MYRFKKGCLGGRSGIPITSVENKGAGQRKEFGSKLPFTTLDNLSNQREESPMMAHRRTNVDAHGNENTVLVGNKLPRANGGKIKDKISLWEGKEPAHSPITSSSSGQCAAVRRTESQTKSNNKTSHELSVESCSRVAQMEKENLGDSRPCSPAETGKQLRGTLKSSKPSENQREEDGKRAAHAESQDHEKENVEKLGHSRPCSPVLVTQQAGLLRRDSDKRAAEQTSQEKRAVFSLFKKLEAMGENHGKSPPELGNYFSPPSKDKQVEVKRKESESVRNGKQHQENVYTEPGALPINPVPKPRRTFQHPAVVPTGKSQRQGRGQRNLPPLPSISTRPSSKLPPGVQGRPRPGRVQDNINRYRGIRKVNSLLML